MREDDTPVMTYHDTLEQIRDGDTLVAVIDPDGDLAVAEIDVTPLGHKMAAAPGMYDMLIETRGWLVERYASETFKASPSAWRNRSAFDLYDRINAALQQADGE